MRRFSLILGLLFPLFLNAQDLTIRGIVTDTSSSELIENAVVSFLRQADSTLTGYTRTNKYGSFEKKLPEDNYIVLVTSPAYADYILTVRKSEHPILNLGKISMISKARLLEEIIVRQQSIRIKGDTTEYMADSFKVKPNATVEDLLKQLPGIQIDKSGNIIAQGQRVQKILVDGDEFFSDDPTIATRNLRADAVKKVQVFDKKSDEAVFTGINDGKEQKALNIELKDAAKNGYFGKVVAGGLDRYYNFQAMVNAFQGKRKLSAFAIASSTSETGLDWQTADNYGFESGAELSEETGGVQISSGGSEGMGSENFSGTGLPESIKGGVHYSNKWDDDKINLNSNYLFNKLVVRNQTQSFAQNILENSVYFSNTRAAMRSDRMRNDVAAILETAIDSTSSFKMYISGSIGRDKFSNDYQEDNLDDQGVLFNKSTRTVQTTIDTRSERISGIYRKRFKRTGQTLSVSFSQRYHQSTSDGSLIDESLFYHPVNINQIKRDTIDQRKTSKSVGKVYSAGATFTQPLSPVSFLVLGYSFTYNNSLSGRFTYDPGSAHDYENLNDSLSSDFKYGYNIHTGSINYRYSKSAVNLSVGGSVSETKFALNDFLRLTATNRNYLNFYPVMDFKYRFSPFRNLKLSYSGSSVQPSISQIQPLIDNMDPLNITVGNPGLKQEFNHYAEILFTDIKLPEERYILAGGSINLTNNQINESYFLDTLGRRISQYVNTNGNYSARLFTMLNLKFPHSDIRFGIGPLAQLYRYSNLVNLKNSITDAINLRMRITLQGSAGEKLNFSFAAMPGYNFLRSNISRISDQNYWDVNITGSGSYQLPAKFEIGSDVVAGVRQKITSFDQNNNIVSWNAYAEKRFLKNESLALRASVFDILDQNKGFYRYQLATGLQEQHYLTWGQYGLISLTWNFVNKGGKIPAPAAGGFTF